MQQQKLTVPSTSFLIACLILLTLGFRIFQLTADPPADFSWSGGYFADEGYWSHNARAQVLFGNPVPDEWDARVVSPIFAFFQKCIFQLFGVGLFQVRIIGILSSLLLTVGSFLIFRKQFDDAMSFFCAALVSLNYPLLVLARQGILDPFAAALVWVALLFLMTESSLTAFLAGILLVGACITKYLMIYTLFPVAAALIFILKPKRSLTLIFLFGVVLAGTIWMITNYIPNRELLLGYSAYYSSQQSWKVFEIVKNIAAQPFYLYLVKTPAILFFGNLMLWFLFIPQQRAGKVERLCWVWLLSGILFLALWRYRPFRYYTSLVPPLTALAGMSLLRIQDISAALQSGKSRVWLLAGFLIPSLQIALLLLDRLFGWQFFPEQLGIHTIDAIIFLALTLFAFMVYTRVKQKAKWILFAFLVVFLAGDMRSYVSWMSEPEYAALEISKDLQQRVGKGVVTGQWAPELCLENRVRAVPVWHGFVNTNDPFNQYGITHLLLWRYPLGDETKLFAEWYPPEFAKFHVVKSYSIKDSELILYETRDAGEK